MHTDPRCTRIYEDSSFENCFPLDQQDELDLEGQGSESKQVEATENMGSTEALGHHITEQDLLAAQAAVEREAQQLQEEGSDDDSDLDLLEEEEWAL